MRDHETPLDPIDAPVLDVASDLLDDESLWYWHAKHAEHKSSLRRAYRHLRKFIHNTFPGGNFA